MSKRVRFETTVDGEHQDDRGDQFDDDGADGVGVPFKKKFHHSLDSDEEDDEVNQEKYNVMDSRDIDGEEEGIARLEDDIKFTAFNMTEELEEGHFDKDGTYIFRKEKDEIKDHWVQNIDNCQIADTSKIRRFQEASDSSQDEAPVDYVVNYKSMLNYMEKGETVKGAIQRIDKCIKDMRTRNRKEKSLEVADEIKQRTKKLEALTELADEIVLAKDIDVYEKTYDDLLGTVKEREKPVDIFADDNDGPDPGEDQTTRVEPGQGTSNGGKRNENESQKMDQIHVDLEVNNR